MSGGESTCHFEEQGKPSIAGRCNKNTSLQKATPPLLLDKLSRELTQWHGVRCPKHCRPSSSSLSAQSSACSVPSGTEIKLHYLSPPKVLISLSLRCCVCEHDHRDDGLLYLPQLHSRKITWFLGALPNSRRQASILMLISPSDAKSSIDLDIR